MEKIYIYHHLGLGDHIICNSIIRHYYKLYDFLYLFVKPHNYNNVKFMYRDLKNIDYIIGDDNFADNYIKTNNIKNLLKIGFEKLDRNESTFDKAFYKEIGMGLEKRWEGFYMKRDINKEINCFKEYGVKENEYVFIHDDRSRGYSINENHIVNKNLQITRPDKFDFFDNLYLIENAREIHCMTSSYKEIIEFLNIKTNLLFLHNYVRNYPNYLISVSKLNWKII